MNPTEELPDLFRFEDGTRVRTVEDWRARRREMLDLIQDIEYGHLPPAPATTPGRLLNSHSVSRLGGARHAIYHLEPGEDSRCRFSLDLKVPSDDGPLPVILNGDACWCYQTDEVQRAVLDRGYILATFNRTEVAPDVRTGGRSGGLFDVYPDADFGALAAWAWAYHRCVDFLRTLDVVDDDRIAATGHSRGGKAVLLAGATDERIAVTAPNNSGCAGAGCFRVGGESDERLANILDKFPYWFSPRFKEYIGRENELPFDQHALKALVAPRPLLTTEALGDLWANPRGTWHTHLAAREAYRFLDAEDDIGIFYREGPHRHGLDDWQVLLDFADWKLKGQKPERDFSRSPFENESPVFSWSASSPGAEVG